MLCGRMSARGSILLTGWASGLEVMQAVHVLLSSFGTCRRQFNVFSGACHSSEFRAPRVPAEPFRSIPRPRGMHLVLEMLTKMLLYPGSNYRLVMAACLSIPAPAAEPLQPASTTPGTPPMHGTIVHGTRCCCCRVLLSNNHTAPPGAPAQVAKAKTMAPKASAAPKQTAIIDSKRAYNISVLMGGKVRRVVVRLLHGSCLSAYNTPYSWAARCGGGRAGCCFFQPQAKAPLHHV